MNKVIQYISSNKEFATSFFKWYKSNYSLAINTFLTLTTDMQVIVIARYIAKNYNLGFHADPNSIVIYFINPFNNVNELINRAKEYGFKNQYKTYYDLETVSIDKAYERALLKVLRLVIEPF